MQWWNNIIAKQPEKQKFREIYSKKSQLLDCWKLNITTRQHRGNSPLPKKKRKKLYLKHDDLLPHQRVSVYKLRCNIVIVEKLFNLCAREYFQPPHESVVLLAELFNYVLTSSGIPLAAGLSFLYNCKDKFTTTTTTKNSRFRFATKMLYSFRFSHLSKLHAIPPTQVIYYCTFTMPICASNLLR